MCTSVPDAATSANNTDKNLPSGVRILVVRRQHSEFSSQLDGVECYGKTKQEKEELGRLGKVLLSKDLNERSKSGKSGSGLCIGNKQPVSRP